MPGEIDVAPISETKNFGAQWRPLSMTFNLKEQAVDEIYLSYFSSFMF